MNKHAMIAIAIVVIGALVVGVAYIRDVALSNRAQIPEQWQFVLPQGDPVAGRTTFEELECGTCHRSFLADEMQTMGPDLTVGYHNLPAEYLAESIIKAHTGVADPNYVLPDDQAGMGKYNHFLTVQELTDLVAFLKQPPEMAVK